MLRTHLSPRGTAILWARRALVLVPVLSLIALQAPLLAEDVTAAGAEETVAGQEPQSPAAPDPEPQPEPQPEPVPPPPPDPDPEPPAGSDPAPPAPESPEQADAPPEEAEETVEPRILTPWIESDQEDYAPGAMVTLTSGNWQPGENVRLVVNDDDGQTWKRDINVAAAEDGRFADVFELPAWFVATYSAVATGEISGVARTTFTDAVVATASVDVTQGYRNTTGNAFVFTVNNVSTASESLGSILITEPGSGVGSATTITGCSPGPAGWVAVTAAGSCAFNTGVGSAIPAGSSATFTVTTSFSAGDNASSSNWSVRANTAAVYVSSGSIAATGALGLALNTYRITGAVIAAASTAVGQPCPAPNTSAPAASTWVIVVCGVNGRGATETTTSGQSSLGGSMIGAPGTFAGGTAANTTSPQVLANYTGAVITGAAGAGKTVIAKIGGSSSRTSPSTTFSGYEALAAEVDPVGSVLIDVQKTNDADETTLPGDAVTFTANVTNSGTTTIKITKVTDTYGTPETEIEVCDGVGPGSPDIVGTSLAPSASTSCSFTINGYAPGFGETLENTVRVEALSLEPLGKFLVADEDTIDNASNAYIDAGGVLQTWTDTHVNDGSLGSGAESGPNPARRTPLSFFVNNVGATITIPAGSSSDPGLFEITGIPRTTDNLSSCSGTGHWADRGPTTSGLRNFIGDPAAAYPHNVGPSLGTGSDPEKCLDKVPANSLNTVAELQALIGQTVCILAKDSDVSYDTGNALGNFQGGYLGVAAFYVNSLIVPGQPGFPGAWSGDLAGLNITILDAAAVCGSQTGFGEAPSQVRIAEEATGSLEVVKAFDGTGSPAEGTEFTIGVNCDDDAYDATLTFDETGALLTGTNPITGIPVGTECSVDESVDGGADSVTYDPDPPTVTITEDGEELTVTVTNTFEQGTIEVIKQLEPESDSGLFDLFIKDEGGTEVGGTAEPVGDEGTTGQVKLPTGTYTVGETAGDGTSLEDYDTEVSCGPRQTGEIGTLGVIDIGDPPGTVVLGDGDDIVCTITNTRFAIITVTKVTDPADAGTTTFGFTGTGDGIPGLITLDTDASDATFEDTETYDELLPGPYSVTENAAPLGWTLDDLVCEGGGDNTRFSDLTGVASIGLDAGENVECTWTNVKTPLSGSVDKTNDADQDAVFGEPEEALEEGQDVTFQLVITNTSPVPVTISQINDTVEGVTTPITECLDGLSVNVIGTVLGAAGSGTDSVTCTFTLTGYAPAPNGSLTNTAAVILTDELSEVTVTDPSTVTTPEVLGEVTERGGDEDRVLGLALTGFPLAMLILFTLILVLAGLALRRVGRKEKYDSGF